MWGLGQRLKCIGRVFVDLIERRGTKQATSIIIPKHTIESKGMARKVSGSPVNDCFLLPRRFDTDYLYIYVDILGRADAPHTSIAGQYRTLDCQGCILMECFGAPLPYDDCRVFEQIVTKVPTWANPDSISPLKMMSS